MVAAGLPFCRCGSSPHTRGTLLQRAQVAARGGGSSPHTRGTPGSKTKFGGIPRLIPAHAGNTGSWASCARLRAAHPRTRGEHARMRALGAWLPGSSPHTRGTQPSRQHVREAARLIPAHAGNTRGWRWPASGPSAHPRTRGEHFPSLPTTMTFAGSSPHTRGTPAPDQGAARGPRLIPAHAGNTPGCRWRRSRAPAHPRTRGEHLPLLITAATASGSSPHTRGTPRPAGAGHHRGRLIPAHAGNTGPSALGLQPHAAHPRTRGEHV